MQEVIQSKKERVMNVIKVLRYALENNESVANSCDTLGFKRKFVKYFNEDYKKRETYSNINTDSNLIKLFEEYETLLAKSRDRNSPQKKIDNQINSTVGSGVLPEQTRFSETANEMIIDYQGNKHIKTLDDLLNEANVDRDIWKVKSHVINKWDVNAKIDGKFQLAQNFQVKAWLEKNTLEYDFKLIKKEMINELKNYSPKIKGIVYNNTNKRENNLLEVNIFDLHLGKLCWEGETFENYDVKIASERFISAIKNLLHRSKTFDIQRILFPIGNDFFNSDNHHNTTTAGTPQDEDLRWKKTYKLGRQLLIEGIELLRQVAPVDVLVIPGNHDTERMFYIGDSLEIYYDKCDDVSIDNHGSDRKYYQFGKNLIGFTHGDKEKRTNLPLLMAQEVPNKWAKSKYREWHLGHLHTSRKFEYQTLDESTGVSVRHLKSLSGTDQWHHGKGYVGNVKGGEGFVWNDNDGLVSHFNFNL